MTFPPETPGAEGAPADAAALVPPVAPLVERVPAEPPSAPAPRRSLLRRFRAWRFAPIIEILGTIALALVLAESVQAAILKPFVIPSGSMEPTLVPNQRVLVDRLAYDFGSPQRGDIVVFHPPDPLTCGDLTVPNTEPCPTSNPKPATQYFVKRIIGLPGDHLSIRGGHPVINGQLLSNEPYISACGGAPDCDMSRTITIPKGEYFMLGDNRGDSDDSRFWGPIPESWIIGEVFATYWPPDRIGVF